MENKEFNKFEITGENSSGKWVIDLAQMASMEVLEESINKWKEKNIIFNEEVLEVVRNYIREQNGRD